MLLLTVTRNLCPTHRHIFHVPVLAIAGNQPDAIAGTQVAPLEEYVENRALYRSVCVGGPLLRGLHPTVLSPAAYISSARSFIDPEIEI